MRIWTRQHIDVLNIINTKGTYRVNPKHIEMKMEEFADYYKKLYQWYSHRAEKIVSKPSTDIIYPIWVSTSEDMQLQPVENTVILELEVDKKLIVVTDLEKWGYIVNYFYLPKDNDDLNKHYAELDRLGIKDESAIIMDGIGNHYPLLKQKIERSWDRLFEPYKLSDVQQGTIWEIKKEWVKSFKSST